jgi:hypothetical protein
MNLFRNGIDLSFKLLEFIRNSKDLIIFSPYVKLTTLKELLNDTNSVKAVYVRWEIKDLLDGASDLDVYYYLKEKGIPLFRNTRLHLKAYLAGIDNCFLTTANISSRALNLPPYANFNYEIGTIANKLSMHELLYFEEIKSESHFISDEVVLQIKSLLETTDFTPPPTIEGLELQPVLEQDFLVSSLPMSYSVEKLYDVYVSSELQSNVDYACAVHDICLYKIPLGLDKASFLSLLKVNFFSQRFISKFLENLNGSGEIYFGEAKEWIVNNCCSVPTPRKWEITSNVQILYRWVVDLGDGKYQVDIPGQRSERLKVNI